MKPTLNELIEEQVVVLREYFGELYEKDGEEVVECTKSVEFRFKNALKEIALQSIEAVQVEEAELHQDYATEGDNRFALGVFRGNKEAREEAKQRAGVFLGEGVKEEKI